MNFLTLLKIDFRKSCGERGRAPGLVCFVLSSFFLMILCGCGIPVAGVTIPEAPVFTGTNQIAVDNPALEPSYRLRVAIVFLAENEFEDAQEEYFEVAGLYKNDVTAAQKIENGYGEPQDRVFSTNEDVELTNVVNKFSYDKDTKTLNFGPDLFTVDLEELVGEGQISYYSYFGLLAYVRAFDPVVFTDVYSEVAAHVPTSIMEID